MENLITTPNVGNGWSCDAEIDTEVWLEAVTDGEVELPEDFDGSEWDNSDEVRELISRLEDTEYAEAVRDNVYNNENDFSSVFTFTVYTPKPNNDWAYCSEAYLAVCLHKGGDPRGNYEGVRLFRINCPAESGFFDWTFGWYVTKPERRLNNRNRVEIKEWVEVEDENGAYRVGYSSSPTYELNKEFGTESGEWNEDGSFTPEGSEVRCYPELCIS